MLDILLSRLKEEIAIDGISGSSIDTVWEYVETISKDIAKQSGASITPLVDHRYKSFIWNYLKSEKDLEFYENIAGQAEVVEHDEQIANQGNEVQPKEAANNYQGETQPQTMEIDDGLIDNNKPNFDISAIKFEPAILPSIPKKRKQPPTSKKKAAPKKKAKSKPKKKSKKKKAITGTLAANSDDDFDVCAESESSSSEESDFEQDESDDDEDSEDQVSEVESEEYESEEDKPKKTQNAGKQSKAPNGKPKKKAIKTILNRIDDISDLTFEQITQKYGSTLYIAGSPELQERQLYIGIPPGAVLSPNLIVILREIIKTRSKGLYQANVTRILSIDSRSTGHYCKSLEERGAIIRNGVSTNKIRTNVCIHVRFVDKNQLMDIADEDAESIPYNVNAKGQAFSQVFLRDSLIDLIKDAPDRAILSEDVLRALGFNGARRSVRKWFNRIIDELSGKGYIRKSNLRLNGRGLSRRCLHLLKIPEHQEKAEDLPMDALEFPIRIKTMREDIPILHILVDSSLESQVLQVLLATGTNGATQREIAFTLNLDEHRILYKLLERMVEMTDIGLQRYGALRFLEFEGRQRRYRYFTYQSYKKRYENIDVEIPPLPEQEMDESKFADRNYFIDIPHTPKEFQKYIADSKNSSTDLNIFSAMGLRLNPRKEKKVAKDPLAPPKKKGRPRLPTMDADGQPIIRKHRYVRKNPKKVTAATNPSIPTAIADASTSEATLSNTEANVSASEVTVLTSKATVPTPEATISTSEAIVSNTNVETGITKGSTNDITNRLVEAKQSNVEISRIPVTQMFETSAEHAKRGRPKKDAGNEPAKKAKHIKNSSVPTTVKDVTVSTNRVPIIIDDGESDSIHLTATAMDVDNASSVTTNTPPIDGLEVVEISTAVELTGSTSVVASAPVVENASIFSPLTKLSTSSSAAEKATKESTKNKKAVAPTAPVRNLRKRTIADYFAKVPGKVTDSTTDSTTPGIANQVATSDSVIIISHEPTAVASETAIIAPGPKVTYEPVTILPEPTTIASESTILTSDPMIVTPETTPLENISSEPVNITVSQAVTKELVETLPTTAQSTSSEVNDVTPTESPTVPEPISSSENNVSSEIEPIDIIPIEPSATYTTTETLPESVEPVSDSPTTTSNASVSPVVNAFVAHGPRAPEIVFKKGYSHNRPKQINIYMEARAKVLLALLEDKPMWEMNKELMGAYIAKAKELNGDFKYTVCNKTLWRSASLLASRREAQTLILHCPLLHGGISERKVLIRIDIDLEGPECTAFKNQLIERRALQVIRVNAKTFDNITAPVERLEGRITRLRENLQQLEDEKKLAEAEHLKEQIGELAHNAQQFKPRELMPNQMSSWLITGVQFGWIRARMLRIKTLYMFMFNLLMSEDPLPGIDKEARSISTITIVTNMKLSTLCQVIGIFSPTRAIIEYVGNPAHADITCKDLPNHIRKDLFSDTNRFRYKIRTLLYGMEFLDLVVPESYNRPAGQKYRSLALSYHLPRKVNIKERKKLGQPVLREHILDNQADVTLFWSELQYAATQISDEIAPDELEPPPTEPMEFEFWKGMYNAINWSTASVYLRSQRKILNSFVDKLQGTTPLENSSICMDIANETNLTIADVRRYYIKVELAIARKKKTRALKNYERRLNPGKSSRKRRNLAPIPNGGRRVINLSSTRAFNHSDRKTRLGLDAEDSAEDIYQRLDGEDSYMDNFNSTPVIVGVPETKNLRICRNKKTTWTPEEDDLLIYCYIIVRQRARLAIRWHAINQIFPQKSKDSGRHRFAKLASIAKYVDQIESASILWRRFYNEGLENGDIEDPDPYEILEFDLLSLLSYFLKRLNEDNAYEQNNILPNSTEDIKRCFHVTRNISDTKAYYFEDSFFERTTLVTQLSFLNHQTFTGRRLKDVDYDNPESAIAQEDSIEGRQLKILMTYSMMTLLTPTEVFDPFFSYAIINSYPSDVFGNAIQLMRDRNCLIQSKQERPVPGTKYSMSARFNTLMCGRLPKNMLAQAQGFDKYLSLQPGKNRLTFEYISSGMMACILDLLSDNKINVTMANKDSKMKHLEHMNFSSRLTDRTLAVFEMDIEKTGSIKCDTTFISPEEPKIKRIDMLKFDIELGYFLKLQDVTTKELLNRMVSALKARRDIGLTLYQLKLELGSEYDDGTIKRGLNMLESNDPALVAAVGFDALRYVTTDYIGTWAIDTKEFGKQEFGPNFKPDPSLIPDNIDGLERKDIILPNIWTDINGNRTDLVLRDCKAVIVDYLIRRPGTSEANIHRKFKAAFDRRGLRTILDILTTQNVLRRVRVDQCIDLKARKSIFSKSRSIKCSNEDTIEEATRSFYWVQPNVTVKGVN